MHRNGGDILQLQSIINLKKSAQGKLDITKIFQRNECLLFIALIILLAIGGLTVDGYLSLFNISRLMQQLSIIGLVAIGMSFVIIGGNSGIDLSVGSIFGISAMVAITLQNRILSSTGSLSR